MAFPPPKKKTILRNPVPPFFLRKATELRTCLSKHFTTLSSLVTGTIYGQLSDQGTVCPVYHLAPVFPIPDTPVILSCSCVDYARRSNFSAIRRWDPQAH